MSGPMALRSTAAPPIGVPGDVGEALDALYTGAVLLSVPLVDDVIQIGTAGTLTTGTIEVTKTPSAIRIRRTDGLPLQAAIVHHRDGRDAAGRLVFAEPVHSLRLRHLAGADGRRRWAVRPGARVERIADLVQLIRTVAAFGRAKQRDGRNHRDAAESA